MNQHLTEAQWMEFVYDEMAAPEKRALERHIEGCPACLQKRGELLATGRALDDWQVTVPPRQGLRRAWPPLVKWAAAAALVATTAFSAGRFSKPGVDLAQVQQSLAKPIQESVERQLAAKLQAERAHWQAEAEKAQAQLAAEMRGFSEKALADAMAANKQQLEHFARTVAALRDEDRKAVYATLQEIQGQLALENRKLREGIETVALVTDRSLRDAQRRLVQLANYTAPVQETN